MFPGTNPRVQAMELIRDKKEMRAWSRRKRMEGQTVALVPTMGFLHSGHLSLVEEAKQRAKCVVVSVYVNPSQFAPGEDLASYPRDLAGDLEKLKPLNVDVVFNPFDLYIREGGKRLTEEGTVRSSAKSEARVDSRWPEGMVVQDESVRQQQLEKGHTNPARFVSSLEESGGCGHETWIRVEKLEKPLCGLSRPVFFRGVATVVAKLFNIVEPDYAVFGKKDYQQWCVLKRMVRDLDMSVEVIGCPLVREADGLAMSSRNVRLSVSERQQALSMSRSLQESLKAVMAGESNPNVLTSWVAGAIVAAGGKVDYVEVVEQESLRSVEVVEGPVVIAVAAWFGGVRLLDNVEVGVGAYR